MRVVSQRKRCLGQFVFVVKITKPLTAYCALLWPNFGLAGHLTFETWGLRACHNMRGFLLNWSLVGSLPIFPVKFFLLMKVSVTTWKMWDEECCGKSMLEKSRERRPTKGKDFQAGQVDHSRGCMGETLACPGALSGRHISLSARVNSSIFLCPG